MPDPGDFPAHTHAAPPALSKTKDESVDSVMLPSICHGRQALMQHPLMNGYSQTDNLWPHSLVQAELHLIAEHARAC